MRLLHQLLCGLRGHDFYRTFTKLRGRHLRCVRCDKTTPGFHGDAR